MRRILRSKASADVRAIIVYSSSHEAASAQRRARRCVHHTGSFLAYISTARRATVVELQFVERDPALGLEAGRELSPSANQSISLSSGTIEG